MGVIEEGTVKGNLPSDQVFAVHYPGYPSSMSRAVETLGGIDAIAKVRSSKENKLELRFRPEDPFSHPAHGQIYPCNSLLLRISKSSISSDQNDGCSSSQPEDCESLNSSVQTDSSSTLSADIVSRVQVAYQFKGMVDYQYVLPVHANVGRRKERASEVKRPADEVDTCDTDDDNLMILVPELFSIKDAPNNIVLRPSITSSSRKKQEAVVGQRWEMEMDSCLAIDFNIEAAPKYLTITHIPKKVNWEKYIKEGSDQWKLQMDVSNLFDERPIWPKSAIFERLGNMGHKIGDYTLKRLLSRCAYYFVSGPFQRFWIRNGYDPRKDPESRIYQKMDFRVPPELRSYCDAVSGMKQKWEDLCAFRIFPNKCQTHLQLFELVDDYIQQEIQRFPKQSVCSRSTGWFSSYAIDNLRHRVALRFLSVYPQGGAESSLKLASEKFEKSKKMRLELNDSKPRDESESLVNQEFSHEEDKANANDDDAEEEDDDEEEHELEDEGVDEMDLDDPDYPGGEDADFSLQSDSYLGTDNISRNYLQELFESFPTSGGAANQLHGEDSEAEYQIYEQDSDDNNSDDDYN